MVDDFNLAVERLPLWANWLFTTPWWVPAALAALLTVFLMWLSWPKQAVSPATAQETAERRGIEGGARFADPDAIDEAAFILGLYLSRVTVDGPNTLPDFYIRISFLFFNATGGPVTVHRVDGVIAGILHKGEEKTSLDGLPQPRLEPMSEIQPLEERYVLLEQRLPREAAEAITQTLSELNRVVELDVSALRLISSSPAMPHEVGVPVWQKITLSERQTFSL